MEQQLCKHFGVCGGCEFQNLPYLQQLSNKKKYIQELFKEFSVDYISDVVPSVDIWYYRNKMEFIIGKENNRVVSGLRQKGKFYKIVDLSECKISYDEIGKVLNIVKSWVEENNLEPYNLLTHKGKVRYLAFKHSKTENKIMLNLVVTGTKYQIENNEKKYFDELVKLYSQLPNVDSIYVSINNLISDNATPEEVFHFYGRKFIVENVNGVNYNIYPHIFFQTNTKCCEVLYKLIIQEIEEGNTLDLYCGSGGITLQVAKYKPNGKIIGVDNSKSNILIALENLKSNNFAEDKIEFVCDNVETFVQKLWKSKFISNLSNIIVDPPRPGLSKKVKSILSDIPVNKIIYVSCNPKTLYEDLKIFIKFYKIKKLIPVDMFPHTPHIEVICVLEHK